MKVRLLRAAVFALLAPLALGGAFGHTDRVEALSQGTQLFHPDHPAHAPFVPEREHACAYLDGHTAVGEGIEQGGGVGFIERVF